MPRLELIFSDSDGTLYQYNGNDPDDPRNRFASSWDALGYVSGAWKEWIDCRNEYYPKVISNPERPEIYEEWLREQVRLIHGLRADELVEKIMPVPYVDGAREFFKEARKNEWIMGIVSGGPSIVVDVVRKELGFDFAVSNHIYVLNGVIRGAVNTVPFFGKDRIVRGIAKGLGVSLERVAVFGDHINDIPAFGEVGLPIAVCPKPEVRDEVIRAAREM